MYESIFIYISSFIAILAAVNSYDILFKCSGNMTAPYYISSEDIHKKVFYCIHNKKDFLTAYYYEITVLMLILNTIFYYYVNMKLSGPFLFVSSIFLFVILLFVYMPYKKYYLNLAKEAFLAKESYKNYFSSYFLKYEINSDTVKEFKKTLNYTDYNSYKKAVLNLNIEKARAISEFEYNKYRHLFSKIDIFCIGDKLKIVESGKIYTGSVFYDREYFVLAKIFNKFSLIKERFIESSLFLYCLMFLAR